MHYFSNVRPLCRFGNYIDNSAEHLQQPRRISTSNSNNRGGHHPPPQSHHLEVATSAGPPASSITCSTSRNVKNGVETIMVHDLTARRSHSNHQQRPGGGAASNGGYEDPTPGSRRPRAKSTVGVVDSMLNQVKSFPQHHTLSILLYYVMYCCRLVYAVLIQLCKYPCID